VTYVSIIVIVLYWFFLGYGHIDQAEIDFHDQKPCKPEKPTARKDSSPLFDRELDS
jgi:hypothetical protein